MLRFFRASRSIQVGTPEVRARSPFSRGRALARSPIGRMRHPVYTKSRLSAAAESLLFGICIRKRYSISLKRPSGPRRFCAVQVFWPKAKTLVQAEFTSAGHVKSSRYAIKITTPKGVVIFMVRPKGLEPPAFRTGIRKYQPLQTIAAQYIYVMPTLNFHHFFHHFHLEGRFLGA